MSVSRIEYLERFLDDADFVISGRRGAISEDRWLIINYHPSFYGAVSKHLMSSNERVRAETVMLFASVRERAALDAVREMRKTDKDVVRTACLGYLNALNESDSMMHDLFDVLEHKGGQEFRLAAAKTGSLGNSDDIPRIRKIYGQVTGDMRAQVRDAISAIIDRDPDMMRKKDLLLSVPVFPDERKFLSFLDNSINYLDIRYRDSIAPVKVISESTYNNVYGAIMKMRVRMFNEYDNLKHYEKRCTDGYNDLISLMEWASGDLSLKTVENICRAGAVMCPECGNEMNHHNGIWTCVRCGIRK
ncbi:MAG: hypothetical protein LBV13_05545 [Methanomassiliicoccaceae archaeon]|jgi:hypothetical protein|nr:hypothetical protein [Methanomassiliicoccaceae archaeon]